MNNELASVSVRRFASFGLLTAEPCLHDENCDDEGQCKICYRISSIGSHALLIWMVSVSKKLFFSIYIVSSYQIVELVITGKHSTRSFVTNGLQCKTSDKQVG